ncbi:M20/M25/M40 family metallo-hydrolase [Modestobacter altitudinis]|uniref:M20/M25/M40 family metallo-hydrolase n=1 Tax=Modestobacter altitudinis TaxID=2213158 RepID=UPI001C55238A|nr:M20/M25/M40 family metallo-hydrolase [Modestobacter altitudinis]
MTAMPELLSPGVFADLLPAMLADLEELVDCETPSSDLAAVARGAELVARQGARALGAEPEVLVREGCTHLRWRLGGGPRRVLVLCHQDTVWPLGTLTGIPWSVTDGVVRGPGCLDMKGGIVLAFTALAQLRAAGTDLDGVTVLVTGDEEVGSPTSADLIRDEARDCAAVFVLEAAADGGGLKTGRKGASMYDLLVTGRAAHAGLEPEKGISATIELAHQVVAIAHLADPGQGTTVTPTVLVSGTTTNTVPAAGRLSVDVRALTAGEQDRVDAGMRALTPHVPGAEHELRGGVNRPPLEVASSADLFALAQQVAARLGLAAPVAVTVGGASDGNFTAGIGVPTLDGLGAVGGGAHAAGEHVLAGELPGRAALVAGLVQAVLAPQSGRHGRDGGRLGVPDEETVGG